MTGASSHFGAVSSPWIRIAARITEARRDAGLTQRELANDIGARPYIVDELENGRIDPRRYTSRIELATRKPPGWLSLSSALGNSTEQSSGSEIVLSTDARLGRNLVLAGLATILTIRFLTQQVSVLPGAGNFIDVALLPLLIIAVAFQIPELSASKVSRGAAAFAMPALLFLAVCVLSAVANIGRVAPLPVLLFIYGFLSPIAFFYVTLKLWPPRNAIAMSRLIVVLGIFQFVVILFFDLPQFLASRNPDDIAGTFGGNAYQLVFFLLVFTALVAGAATFERDRVIARFAPLFFGLTFLVIFLAQYRALLFSTALTIVFVAILLGSVRGRGILVAAFAMIAFVGALAYVSANYPAFKFASTLTAARDDPTLFVTGRLAPGKEVLALYGDEPGFVVAGAGPGTYSSRAWRTFADLGNPANPNEGAAQPYVIAISGGRAYETDVSARYVLPRLRSIATVLGSNAVNSPFSSYLALLAEVGLLGFSVMVFIYVSATIISVRIALAAMRRATPRDPLPALALATAVAFFLLLQMAFLENWWEVARVTIPSWMLLAVCMKERQAAESVGQSAQ